MPGGAKIKDDKYRNPAVPTAPASVCCDNFDGRPQAGLMAWR
jgi:hypothetical protein